MSGFDPLFKFEKEIAAFFGAKYGVGVDCCTHGLELCLRLKDYKTVEVPVRTYVSVPFMLEKIKQAWRWKNEDWNGSYFLTNDIIDASVLFKENAYIAGTKMVLSFHFKKHINIGRGGMILLDNEEEKNRLGKMRYDGRSIYEGVLHRDEDIDEIGYHYYMTPETAAIGSEIFNKKRGIEAPNISSKDYRDLRTFSYFK